MSNPFNITGVVSGNSHSVLLQTDSLQTAGTLNANTATLNQLALGPGAGFASGYQLNVLGDVFVSGNIVTVGQTFTIGDQISVSEQVKIENYGSGPALVVDQYGTQHVADFRYNDATVAKIWVGGTMRVGDGVQPSQTLEVAGNLLTTGFFLGNGSMLSGMPWSFISGVASCSADANVAGNISTASLFVGNGAGLTGLPWTVGAGQASCTGNVIVGNLRSSADLDVGGTARVTGNIAAGGYFIGNVALASGLGWTNSANTTSFSGNVVAGSIVTSGNVFADKIFANGALLSGLPWQQTGSAVSFLGTAVTLGLQTGNIKSSGDIVASGNLTANGFASVGGNLSVGGDFTLFGNLSVTPQRITVSSLAYTSTQTLNVTNFGAGPALAISQFNSQPVATFSSSGSAAFGIDASGSSSFGTSASPTSGNLVRIAGNASVDGSLFTNNVIVGNSVGINTSTPTQALDVAGYLKTTHPAFFVSAADANEGGNIIMTNVYFNAGGCLNPTQNRFSAPVSGMYIFSSSLNLAYGATMFFQLGLTAGTRSSPYDAIHRIFGLGYAADSTQPIMYVTNNACIYLTKGCTVTLSLNDNTTTSYADPTSYFSGALLFATT